MQKYSISNVIPSQSHSHSHLILDPGSAFYGHIRGREFPSEVVVAFRFRIRWLRLGRCLKMVPEIENF